MTEKLSHQRLPDTEGPMGRTTAHCSCGWDASTNRPGQLSRTYRSHIADAQRRSS